jgi:hypothetical protein
MIRGKTVDEMSSDTESRLRLLSSTDGKSQRHVRYAFLPTDKLVFSHWREVEWVVRITTDKLTHRQRRMGKEELELIHKIFQRG